MRDGKVFKYNDIVMFSFLNPSSSAECLPPSNGGIKYVAMVAFVATEVTGEQLKEVFGQAGEVSPLSVLSVSGECSHLSDLVL